MERTSCSCIRKLKIVKNGNNTQTNLDSQITLITSQGTFFEEIKSRYLKNHTNRRDCE